jgi:predicted phage tail component-like protein
VSSSFSFGGVDFATYGVYIQQGKDISVMPPTRENILEIAGKHGVYDFGSHYNARYIEIPCVVVGTSRTDLLSKLDLVKTQLDVLEGDRQLVFDDQSDRYYNAKYDGDMMATISICTCELSIPMICVDPFAYSKTETVSEKTISSTPDTVTEKPGGMVEIKPVWRVIPGSNLSGATITINNATLDQSLSWTGDLLQTDYLEIDSENWTVKKNTTISMGTVNSGLFPTLKAGSVNSIKTDGFTGTLRITYRNKYL